jgi:hypothetical protein
VSLPALNTHSKFPLKTKASPIEYLCSLGTLVGPQILSLAFMRLLWLFSTPWHCLPHSSRRMSTLTVIIDSGAALRLLEQSKRWPLITLRLATWTNPAQVFTTSLLDVAAQTAGAHLEIQEREFEFRLHQEGDAGYRRMGLINLLGLRECTSETRKLCNLTSISYEYFKILCPMHLSNYCIFHVTLPFPNLTFISATISKWYFSVNSSWIELKFKLWLLIYVI